MSMLRAVAWGMVELDEFDAKQRVDIKRAVTVELQPHKIKVCPNPGAGNYQLARTEGQPFRIASGSYRECCQLAAQIITRLETNTHGGNE